MSKLSPSLKALINAPFARPGQTPAPRRINDVFTRIAHEARERQYGERSWLTLAAAATFTLNSPASLLALHSLTPSVLPATTTLTPLASAELIRAIGLKCISFNGIPRTINCLGAFKAGLAHHPWARHLATAPTRQLTPANLPAVAARGRALWHSVYTPFDDKLEAKLADSHPDLPVHILECHYGPLLSDPPPPAAEEGEAAETSDGQQAEAADGEGGPAGLARLGRNLTSVVAIACLRAQTGVGPQVLSHVFGLRKGVEQGLHRAEFAGLPGEAEAVERLASDEGSEWLLRSVDAIAEAIGGALRGQI
ncbi:42b83349-2b1d-483b-9746-4b73ae134c8e [Thermothielavioides terrestris]|uniref:42b83349-2b1d-483b-9746-4b73ae134c8e n=1 Tax=Thermothielavioides terrestris TaxID=2587410 RepID=A0A446BQ58_9PEZI|nr:42b83349-2b1d-483b-9746-4b73ae134c8e [Thermothielavioides terrestris]